MKTISILNLKGGVAKTFTAANMAYELWRRGYKVLLLDNDKQGNLSKAYGRYDAENVAPITKLLSGEWEKPEQLINHTAYEGMDIITANMSLFGATWNLTKAESENQTERYKKLLSAQVLGHGWAVVDSLPVEQAYDYCIIDNPPDIGLNVVNALAITDEVIVPVKIDEDALEGLDIVTEQIEDAKALNPSLTLRGVLVTVYQNTDGEAAGVEWLGQQGKYDILGIIKYSKKVAENSFMRKPIYEYSPCCGAAQSYKKFATAYTGKER
ncbi:ParA family protein [Konateibacter massiliensis]|uniref:ParA family protein n=1 Tax=Konateibacter massiliensis TaxID=2002841 RepID=UPI000C1457AE|nr:ParA family protein [Konateibacter massiliensis]